MRGLVGAIPMNGTLPHPSFVSRLHLPTQPCVVILYEKLFNIPKNQVRVSLAWSRKSLPHVYRWFMSNVCYVRYLISRISRTRCNIKAQSCCILLFS